MKCFQFAPRPLFTWLALFAAMLAIAPLAANAQRDRDKEVRPNYFENDNAPEMQRWFADYLNPNHDPHYWQNRMNAIDQFSRMRNTAALKANPMAAWQSAGISQNDFLSTGGYGEVSGRVLSFDIAADGTFYLSPAAGGLWKSNDRGQNWVAVSDGKINSICISAIATDPKNANVIYAGTGEAWAGLSQPYSGNAPLAGNGVYKSTDAGLTWKLINSTMGSYVQKLLVSPANSDVVYASASNGSSFLLWRSKDGGSTWSQLKNGTANISLASGIETYIMDPTNPMILYANIGGSLLKTIDGGDTWTKIADATGASSPTGLPRSNSGYTAMAMTPANPNLIYCAAAIAASRKNSNGDVIAPILGKISYSTDGGANWQVGLDTATSPNNFITQGDYCVALAANPAPGHEGEIFFGGLDVFAGTGYGNSLSLSGSSGANSNAPNFVHADVRLLKYFGDTLFALTDGGIFYYYQNAWHHEMNNTLNTFQQLGGDVFVQNNVPAFFIAGAQDNGTTKWSNGGMFGPIIHGGDGGRCFVEQTNGNSIYATYPEFRTRIAALYRSDDGGTNFSTNLFDNCPDYYGVDKSSPNDRASGYAQYDVCEKNFNEAVLCGAKYGWITHNGFQTMTKMSNKAGTTTMAAPSYIHISKANPQTLYWGTYKQGASNVYWTTDAGITWAAPTTIMADTGVAKTLNGSVASITSDPKDETQAYLVTMNGGGKPFYFTNDGGQTWTQPVQKTDDDSTLPKWQYRTIAADFKGRVFIGGDGGILAYDPTDQTWVTVANGIPPGTIVTQLQVRGTGKGATGSTGWLVATTYGRGMYYIKVDDIFKVQGVSSNDAAPSPAKIESIYPNPISANGASTIKYNLESGSAMQIAVFDNLGRQERLLANEWSSQGDHEKTLDLAGLPSGTHYVMLTADGVSISKAVTIQ